MERELRDILNESMNNSLSILTKEAIERFQQKREELIINRLKDFDITLVVEVEQKRRFKKLVSEFKGNEETVYYNDGSIEGLRIITFVTNQLPFNDKNHSIGVEITWY